MTSRQVVLEGGSPWGFRIHGGCDIGLPIKISRVNPGSKAALKGLREGDIISSINETSTKNLDNSTAHSLLRNAGEQLRLSLNEDGLSSPRRRLKQTVITTVDAEQKNLDDSLSASPVPKTNKKNDLFLKSEDASVKEDQSAKKKRRSRGLQNVFRALKLIAFGKSKKSRKPSKVSVNPDAIEVFTETPQLTRTVCIKDLRTAGDLQTSATLASALEKYPKSPKKLSNGRKKFSREAYKISPEKPRRSHLGKCEVGRSPVLTVKKPGLRSPIITRAGSLRSRKVRGKAKKFSKLCNETSFLTSIAEEYFCKFKTVC